MFSVPLSVLSLLHAGSKLFFFTLHPFYKGYCLFNALSFLSVFLDCFEHRLKFFVCHSFVDLLVQVFHRLSVSGFPTRRIYYIPFSAFCKYIFQLFFILEQEKNAPERTLRGDAHSTVLAASICGISTASSFGTSLCSISLMAASI